GVRHHSKLANSAAELGKQGLDLRILPRSTDVIFGGVFVVQSQISGNLAVCPGRLSSNCMMDNFIASEPFLFSCSFPATGPGGSLRRR
ncbi:MAG TPA: hypothetical protein PLB62_15160, partial [Candidatus Sumerlaeota bacterium]|nr:hypothetical protein [Candidatus Sumerlaeota bacterium]